MSTAQQAGRALREAQTGMPSFLPFAVFAIFLVVSVALGFFLGTFSPVFGGIVGESDAHTIYAGSLDDSSRFRPEMAIFNRDRPAWARPVNVYELNGWSIRHVVRLNKVTVAPETSGVAPRDPGLGAWRRPPAT